MTVLYPPNVASHPSFISFRNVLGCNHLIDCYSCTRSKVHPNKFRLRCAFCNSPLPYPIIRFAHSYQSYGDWSIYGLTLQLSPSILPIFPLHTHWRPSLLLLVLPDAETRMTHTRIQASATFCVFGR